MIEGQLPKRDVRFTELDALRGIAALTVVFSHLRLLLTPPHQQITWKTSALLLISAGQEAVFFFFLLSGFVLSLPLLRGKKQPYFVFLIRRIIRIYGPYLGALAIALIGASIWHAPPGSNRWENLTWTQPVNWRLVVHHILFIGNYDWAQYNTAFWSLVIEMRISIIFPFMFLLVQRLRAAMSLVVACLCSIIATIIIARWPEMAQTMMTLEYAAIFICGILLATYLDTANAWYQRLSSGARIVLLLVSASLYAFGHQLALMVRQQNFSLDLWLIVPGAAGYMLLSLNSQRISAVLNSVVPKFLGRISYSLYLVHSTVLFALVRILPNRLSLAVQIPIYVVASIFLSYLFCIALEEPCLRLGRCFASQNKTISTPSLCVGEQVV